MKLPPFLSSLLGRKHVKHYHALNNSKLLAGVGLILLNLFSKYVELNLSKTQEQFIRNSIGREILIFTMLYVGTKDILFSIVLTAAFLILSNTVFHEESRYCLMPKKHLELHKELDTNKHITDKEVQAAHEVIYKANIQKHKLEVSNKGKPLKPQLRSGPD